MNNICKYFLLVLFSCFNISNGIQYDIKTIATIMDAYEKQLDSIKFKYSYESYLVDKQGNRELLKGTFAQKIS